MSYQFDVQASEDAMSQIKAVTNRLEQSLSELTRAVNNYSQANAGAAASAYQSAQNTANAGAVQMNEALGRHAVNLQTIGGNYVDADNAGAKMFSF